jgi:hypothetical protein
MIKKLVLLALVLTLTLAPASLVIAKSMTFTANLSAGEEVPTNDSLGRGQAIFKLSKDGLTLEYKLVVANIENVVASHIHIAPAGQNGAVVAFLYGTMPAGGGPFNGVLAEGTITAADLVGSLAGQPLSALIAEIEAGNAYVNVHTNDGVAPTNTGPGDIPGGEIRGQIR